MTGNALFWTNEGISVPAVTVEQMREVDRIAERTLTLALPKTGLRSIRGDLFVADIGIPPEVYLSLGLSFEPFFEDRYWIRLRR
jgi:hypothetical protein